MKKLLTGLFIGLLLGVIPTFVYMSYFMYERETALNVSYAGTRLSDITLLSNFTAEKRYCVEIGLANSYINEIERETAGLRQKKYRFSNLTKWWIETAEQAVLDHKDNFVEHAQFNCKNT